MKKREHTNGLIIGGIIGICISIGIETSIIKNHITTEIDNRNKIDSLQLEVDKRDRMIQTFSENHDVDVVGVAIEADNFVK